MTDPLTTSQTEFEFAALPGGWTLLLALSVLLGLLYVVVLLYRFESRRSASPRLRYSLAAVRCAAILLLAAIATRPVMVEYLERITPATLFVLVDRSTSMQVSDPSLQTSEARQTRTAQVDALLADTVEGQTWLERLGSRNRLELLEFAGATRGIANAETDSESDSFTGAAPTQSGSDALVSTRTDIGQAISDALARAPSAPIAGLIVLSDGQINRGADTDAVAELLTARGAPVFAVGVGAEAEPFNARVLAVRGPGSVPLGDPFPLEVEVAANAPRLSNPGDEASSASASGALEVVVERVSLTQQAEAATEIERRRLDLDPRGVAAATFEIVPESTGAQIYRARIADARDEATQSDNQRSVVVDVVDDQLRVLIVAGRPSYEYRYVTRLLERDETIDVSCWLQSADETAVRDGNTVIDALPRVPSELFEYDVLLLMDADPAGLDSATALLMRRLVDEFGGGLIYQAGTHFGARFMRSAHLGELLATLPVKAEFDLDVRLSEAGTYRTASAQLRVPERARLHPLLDWGSARDNNIAIWQNLPGVWWSLPIRQLKPIAEPLLRRGSERDGAILLATQPFGAGRTLFWGMDGTWRWRGPAEERFNEFWIRAIRYAGAARRQAGSARGRLALSRTLVERGSIVRVEAQLRDADFAPLVQPTVEAIITHEGVQTSMLLDAAPGRVGWFEGRLIANDPGITAVSVTLDDSDVSETLTAYLSVEQPDFELRQVAMNSEVIARLGSVTAESAMLTLTEARALPERIESAAERRVARVGADDLWDQGALLGLLAALLCVEWTLRRRSNLL